jgi:hypothetical protein
MSIVFFHCIYVLYLLLFYGYNSIYVTCNVIPFSLCIHYKSLLLTNSISNGLSPVCDTTECNKMNE